MDTEYNYAMADETELDDLLSGHEVPGSVRWAQWSKRPRPKRGTVGVVWQNGEHTVRPLILIVNEDDIRRLCGRYAHLHNDLSPLSSWCHILTPGFFEPLESLVRDPELGGLEAAWTGLVVAEAVLLSGMPLARVKISACLATHSFAIARAKALWNHLSIDDVTSRFDNARRLLGSDSLAQRTEGRAGKLRSSFRPIWDALVAVSERSSYRSGEMEPIVAALQALSKARLTKEPREADQLMRPLLRYLPEAEALEKLTDLAPESRLRVFDGLVAALDSPEAAREKLRRNALTLVAGYLATVAAGGSPSLSLMEGLAARWPEITAWAYITGGLGEKVLWTSSFDGLGRLVARELQRPLRLDEPPTCDFAFDEAAVVVDAKLSDPLVHLKVKQARLLTVELFPGVNVPIPIGETGAQSVPKAETTRPPRTLEPSLRDPIGALAEAIWPHIRSRLDDYLLEMQHNDSSSQEDEYGQRSRGRRKAGQPQLPLGNRKRY